MHLRIAIASALVVAATSNASAYKWRLIANNVKGIVISDTGCTATKEPEASFCSRSVDVGTVANCYLNRQDGQPMPPPGITSDRYRCTKEDRVWCAYKDVMATATPPGAELHTASLFVCTND
jgi:hypothetical protein